MQVAYRKTVTHLDDLRYASRKASDLLEEVNEPEWKNSHVTYRNTHSVYYFLLQVLFLPVCCTNSIHVHATELLFGSAGRRYRSHQQMYPLLLDKMIERALLTLMAEAVGTI